MPATGQHTSLPGQSPGVLLLLSMADGALIGAGAGVAYAIIIALWGTVAATPTVSGFLGLALVAGLVAVPTGVVLGAGLGIVFGAIALAEVPYLAWLEASVVAVFGAIIVVLAVAGSGGVGSAVLAWTSGPLLVGVPGAALHGYRLQRRTGA